VRVSLDPAIVPPGRLARSPAATSFDGPPPPRFRARAPQVETREIDSRPDLSANTADETIRTAWVHELGPRLDTADLERVRIYAPRVADRPETAWLSEICAPGEPLQERGRGRRTGKRGDDIVTG
jgi:hypothetical protein